MKEELYGICSKILESKDESGRFIEMQTADELYEYLKEKVPDLSEKEFEDFIVDVLEQYKESSKHTQNSTGPIDDALGNIAGGFNLGQKIASAGLVLMGFLPAAGATNFNKDVRRLGSFEETSISQRVNKDKPVASSNFQRIKNWVKNNKLLIAGTALATVVAGGIVYKVYNRNRASGEKQKQESVEKIIEKKKEKPSIREGKATKVEEKTNKGKKIVAKVIEKKREKPSIRVGKATKVEEKTNKGKKIVAKVIEKKREKPSIRVDKATKVEEKTNKGKKEKERTRFWCEAVKAGDVDEVEKLVKSGYDVNGAVRYGDTALIWAAENGKIDMVKMLIKNKADLDVDWNGLGTALCRALSAGHIDVAKELIRNGADVNKGDALAYAVNYPDIFKRLIDRGANIKSSHALHSAAAVGKVDMVKPLIGMGFDINAKVKLSDGKEYTPLMFAIEKGRVDVVKELIKSGVNLEIQDDKNKATALFYALWNIEEVGSDVSDEIVLELVNAGANVNAKGAKGDTPLTDAFWYERSDEVVKAIIDHGAELDEQSRYGWTALMWAARKERTNILGELLSREVDVNIRNGEDNTALSIAVDKGNEEIAKKLLDSGRVSRKNKQHAKKLAEEKGNQSMVDLINGYLS